MRAPHAADRPGRPSGWFANAQAVPRGEAGRAEHAPASLERRLREVAARREPFALLDDQSDGDAMLFTEPKRIFAAQDFHALPRLLAQMRDALAAGSTLVGFLSYRAGAAFDALAQGPAALLQGSTSAPLLWFGEFGRREVLRAEAPDRRTNRAIIRPAISRSDYEQMVAAALDHIRGGDVYQINLTFPLLFEHDDPVSFYCHARQRAKAPFGAFVCTGDRHIQSYSPELFFRLADGGLEARPMKGTRKRSACPGTDRANARSLIASDKDRAENLMIVDLLRNDMARVCEPGTVRVPRLFNLEAYPTVWQMTSTIVGKVRCDARPLTVLEALFPCGSITGAPKIMASRIISDLERYDRGIYTGAIGMIGSQQAVFNVAIRTVDQTGSRGRMDVGAGIVADSKPRAEWLECLAKSRFLEL